jgi:hypothetical protein
MFATTLQDGRVDPLIRNLLMGHASAEQRSACYGLGMTAVYSHSRPETIRKQLEGALAMRCAVAVANELAGGFGNDNLQGGANADTIHGDVGDDAIHGHTGDDVLYGDADADKLFGGDGMDILHGGIGNDSLVSIDNTTSDALFGEAGLDSFWADEITSPVIFADGMPDISPEESGTNVHRVRRFVNGADRTLNGDAIADPRDETNYGSFRMNPLFASTGPSENDVNQGSIGDCWLLAPLAGIARADQNAIHQIIADMGDGTYAVRLGGNYYRVDADLPVLDFVSMNLEYARVGQENCIWVPLVEKAYAHFRTGANTYASLDRGWETEALRGLNATDIHQRFVGTDRDDLDEGRTYLRSLLGTLESRMATGTVVTVAFMSIEFMCPCENEHAYTLVAVNRDDVGRIVSVTLRNPWGYDGGPEDVPDDSDPSDGLVTVTIGQMLHSDTYVSWGDVG